MKAVMLAAGVGERLGESEDLPKCLLEIGGETLLQRHFDILRHCGVDELTIGVGYRAELIEAAIAAVPELTVRTVINPSYDRGSLVTFWSLREHFAGGGDVLLMDADVLYDHRLMQRLTSSAHRDCFLLDRDFDAASEEPVKLCVRGGRLVEFRKRVSVATDFCGESVGFFRFSESTARALVDAAARYIHDDRLDEPYEEAIRDVLLADGARFGYEDVTGLPWIEIDFPEDVIRARDEVLPRLHVTQQQLIQQ
ncbi:MAG: NTP transferase domain-containing protein [Burkholderiaceae bacterium]